MCWWMSDAGDMVKRTTKQSVDSKQRKWCSRWYWGIEVLLFFFILKYKLYQTYLTSPHLTSPHLTSPHLTSPHLTSPHLTSPHLPSHLTSPHLISSPFPSLPFPSLPFSLLLMLYDRKQIILDGHGAQPRQLFIAYHEIGYLNRRGDGKERLIIEGCNKLFFD